MERDIKKRAYYFSLSVVKFIDSIESRRIHFSLIDQLLRSATSVGANLIEARSAHSRKDFIKFYEIALKSANETKYWLCLLRDSQNVDPDNVKALLNEADEISKIIATIVIKLKKSRKPLPSVEEEPATYLPF
jgi:four helix bundle protein